MSVYEYVNFILHGKEELTMHTCAIPENESVKAAHLISGSFTYLFYETMWLNDYPMGNLTTHLEALYDCGDYYGFIYFVILLAESSDFQLPSMFYKMSISETLVSPLCAAIIEDWLQYDNEYEEIEETPSEKHNG